MTFMIFCGSLAFLLNYFHLLNSLLSLELMAVSTYCLIGCLFSNLGSDMFYLLYFLVMLICEGVLGLSLLIVSCYNYSEDYMTSFNSLMW